MDAAIKDDAAIVIATNGIELFFLKVKALRKCDFHFKKI